MDVISTNSSESSVQSAIPAPNLPENAPENLPESAQNRAHYLWKPGQSGNPSGYRDKNLAELRVLARTYTVEAIEQIATLMRDKKQKGAVRLAAAKELLDRGYGKPNNQDTDNHGKDNALSGVMADCLRKFFGDTEQMRMLEAPIQITDVTEGIQYNPCADNTQTTE